MPAAIAVAGIAAASQLGGAVMGNRANNRAQDAQERAAREAMAYQRQKDKQARDDYRFQYNAWRDQFYGGNKAPVTGAMANTGITMDGAAPAAGAVTPGLAGFTGAAPATLPGEVPAAPGAVPAMAASPNQPRTLADIGPWSASNFGQYLGRR